MAKYEEITNIEKYPNIARKFDTAERLMDSDPDMAVTAMRTAEELMLKQLCLKTTGAEGADNNERINALNKDGVIDDKLSDGLHKIRLTANDSLHEGYEVANYDAEIWYTDVLRLAKVFVEVIDPDSKVNRGIKLSSAWAIVPEQERVTAGWGMTREERSDFVKRTAIDLRRYIDQWKERCRTRDIDNDLWLWEHENELWNEIGRFTIPYPVQEFFVEYSEGKCLGPVGYMIEYFSGGLDMKRPLLKGFILEAAKKTSSVILPQSDLWDVINLWKKDGTYDYQADMDIRLDDIRLPSRLLNEAFVGSDGSGRRPMHLTAEVTELTLPDDIVPLVFPKDWARVAGFFPDMDLENMPEKMDLFDFPRDLPLMMIYFPKLEKVNWRGVTYRTDELISDGIRRWMDTGLIENERLANLKGEFIPDGPGRDAWLIPKELFDIGKDAVFFLFTLYRFHYPDGLRRTFTALDPTEPKVVEYIKGISGDLIKFRKEVHYPLSMPEGLSYRKCYDPALGEQVAPISWEYDYYHISDCNFSMLLLPDWVFDGALALGTSVKDFLAAVSIVRPDLFDTYMPENHIDVPEPVPVLTATEPFQGLAKVEPSASTTPAPEMTLHAKAAPLIRFCPYCGAPAEGFRFCGRCGKQLIK